ncbi:MAG: ATP-dependent RecD-like DNA helicase [Minisyncoccales bacterium]
MRKVDEQINIVNESICKLIDTFGADQRGFLSQNILDKLRTFVEAISVKAAGETEYSYEIFEDKAKNYVASKANLRFLSKFHKFLQHSKSHYATDEEVSERLMLKYYEYLLKIKSFLKTAYNFEVLNNIDKFPLNTDRTLNEYYEKIAKKIKEPQSRLASSGYNERFYIQKVKPFFVNQEIFYEVTFRIADDKTRKFDRLIAFTKLEIIENYAVKFIVSRDYIEVSGKRMPIQIVDDWEVSIRPCEFKNYENIFASDSKEYSRTKEYDEIMSFLTETGLNLIEIIDFPDNYYNRFKNRITQKATTARILDLLDKSREFVQKRSPGTNVLRYLLYHLNNRVIKEQYNRDGNLKLSNLNLLYGCIPFDEMPFASCPVKHTPVIYDLLDCIDDTGREHELFARRITSNAEIKGWLYTPIEDMNHFEDINGLIDKFNSLLYQGTETQRDRKLEIYKDHVYITGYENAVIEIVRKLKDLSESGIKNYSNSINAWLASPDSDVDCSQKKAALRGMFTASKVSLIYGAAGTGKTKLIEHISKFHNERSKLYLANTHSAVSNLRSRITAQNTEFKTIRSFLNENGERTEFDILIIDECSVVSNIDMRDILRKASFGALILVGDVFQIESIRFGNWFYIAKSFVPESSAIELTVPWRAKKNSDLLRLWDKVRNLEEDIDEHITQNKYSSKLDGSIFKHSEDDEIILCLNYDGFYGINNINRFLQESNEKKPVAWGVHTYKTDDPVLFNESNRFGSVIHNNLKGKILNIQIFEERIQFDIQIDKVISELDIRGYDDLELLDSIEEATSVIRFSANKLRSTDEDDDDSASDIIPFQVAYAVSIHKAQGLEYDSVKIVITNETEERISHNVFYTAITRAKKKLKIYWTPETQNKIIGALEQKFNKKDAHLLKYKFSL